MTALVFMMFWLLVPSMLFLSEMPPRSIDSFKMFYLYFWLPLKESSRLKPPPPPSFLMAEGMGGRDTLM